MKYVYKALLFLAFSSVINCKTVKDKRKFRDWSKLPPKSTRLIGGRNAETGEHPYVVNILLKNFHLCTGAYIRPKWVLTSAECLIQEREKMKLTLIMGSVKLDGNDGQVRYSHKTYMHHGYNKKKHLHNIGLIELEEAFEMTSSVSIVKLTRNSKQQRTNSTCFISGWGANKVQLEKAATYSDTMQVTNLTMLSDDDCDIALGWFAMLPEEDRMMIEFDKKSMTCANENGCHGDSGAPVICGQALSGILSWSLGCEVKSPAVIEDVHYNIQWLEDVTGFLNFRSNAIPVRTSLKLIIYGQFIIYTLFIFTNMY